MWPDHYPPKGGWKLFFIGLRWLGPDLSFFHELADRQSRRNEACMNAWKSDVERRLANLIGQCFRDAKMGWKGSYFVPADRFAVMVTGPRYQAMDDLAADAALNEIERKIGRSFPDEFWEHATKLSFGEVVRELLERGSAA